MDTGSPDLTSDDQVYLESWEEVHKKSMLTFWVLHHLSSQSLSASELYTQLYRSGQDINEHSLYRILRRFYDIGLVDTPSKNGKVKYYQLSLKGKRILQAFIQHNIYSLHTIIATRGDNQ